MSRSLRIAKEPYNSDAADVKVVEVGARDGLQNEKVWRRQVQKWKAFVSSLGRPGEPSTKSLIQTTHYEKQKECLISDVRCACRSCRFKKCLQVGMNPRAIQSSRSGFGGPSPSPSKDTSPSTTPEPSIQRKRGFDVCSLLDLPPSCSTAPVPVDFPFHSKLQQLEVTTRVCDLLALEEKVDALRCSSSATPSIILDILTRPSALLTIQTTENPLPSAGLDLDKEMFILLEYAKAFPWFCHLNFSDKFALLSEKTVALLALRQAWKRSTQFPQMEDGLSPLLSTLVDSIRRMSVDTTALALLSVVLLSENGGFSLSSEAKDELDKEKSYNVACLSAHLFQRHGAAGAAQLAQHLSLLWCSLKAGDRLKETLRTSQPAHSLCRQLIDNAGGL